MLVQLNRTLSARAATVTATDLPISPAGLPIAAIAPPVPRRPLPVVALFGHAGRVAGLAQHLPPEWSLRRPTDLDDVLPGELVLFAGAGVREVAAARAVLPARQLVIAVVDDNAPAEVVAGVLTAGADVCVRGGQPAILAGHLVSSHRRQVADRDRRRQCT